MKRPKIMCVGTYESLQVARSLILQQHGYEVVIVNSTEAAVAMASEQHFDAAVLCNSLGAADSARLAHQLGIVSPSTQVIALAPALNAAVAETDSPAKLISQLQTVLKNKGAAAAPQRHEGRA